MAGPETTTAYLQALFGSARPATFVELRWRVGSGMHRRFLAASDLDRVAAQIAKLRVSHDVYVGVLPRWRRGRGGTANIVGDCRTVWVDLDVTDGLRALEPVDPSPTLIVGSGAAGHVHAYWRLRRAVPPRMIERANGRLAYALGGDLRAVDAARILRPPATINHKHAAAVELLNQQAANVTLGELVGGLPDAPTWRAARPRRRQQPGGGLLGVAPEVYVERLTGQRVGRSRKVHCPLHEDATASLHVYPDAQRGWYCFGCARGGTVFDLAAALWGRSTRGAGFVTLRADLTQILST